MNNIYGITDIRVKTIEVNKNNVSEVNEFLAEYDGDIIDIQTVPMFQGYWRAIIVYHEKENG